MRIAIGAAALLLTLAACQSTRPVSGDSAPADEPSRAYADAAERRDDVALQEAAPEPAEMRIQRQGWIRVDVPDEMPAAAMLRRRAADFEAIVMAFSTNTVTLKMPATQLEKLLKELENTDRWEIDEFDFSAWDRTGEFWSLEARIESTTAVRDRMLELVKRADDIETLLKLESRLEGVQQRLDELQGTKREIELKAGRVDVKILFD
jgi:DNA repair exonuclease SbcCD ATPase subunit